MQSVDTIKDFFAGLVLDRFSHTYTVKEEAMPSTSHLIKQVTPEFDWKGVSTGVAQTRKVPAQQVLGEWEDIKKEACDRGHRVHDFAEEYTWNKEVVPGIPQERGVVKLWGEIPEYLVPVATELQMYHKLYKYAGTADLILCNLRTGKYIIADYKTNKDLFKNYRGQRLLYPFSSKFDTPFSKYSLQLSYYQLMLEQVPGIEVERRVIIWLDRKGGYDLYDVEDCTEILEQELIKRN